jgi:hypothetical protein
MPLAGFEPAIPASKLPQIHALDCAACGIGFYSYQKLNLGTTKHKIQNIHYSKHPNIFQALIIVS